MTYRSIVGSILLSPLEFESPLENEFWIVTIIPAMVELPCSQYVEGEYHGPFWDVDFGKDSFPMNLAAWYSDEIVM